MSEVRMNIKDKLKNNNLGKIKNNLKRKEWTEDDLYEFLIGNILNNSQKSIYDLWYADNYFLEHNHKYIQWMFPTKHKSKYSPKVPYIINEKRFIENKKIKEGIMTSFNVFLKFLGLAFINNNSEIGKAPDNSFMTRSVLWLNWSNHNYKRITRILECLMLFGYEKEAHMFYDCLYDLYKGGYAIDRKSLLYWRKAIGIK